MHFVCSISWQSTTEPMLSFSLLFINTKSKTNEEKGAEGK